MKQTKTTRKLGAALTGHEPMTFVTWRRDGQTKTVLAKDRNLEAYIGFLQSDGFEIVNLEGAFWSQSLHRYVTIPAPTC